MNGQGSGQHGPGTVWFQADLSRAMFNFNRQGQGHCAVVPPIQQGETGMSKAVMAESVMSYPPERCNIRVYCAVQDHSKATGTARTLLLVLARFANDDGECWPSIAVLAKLCNVSERGVQRAITTLVKDRELEVSRGSGITTSFYRICCLSGVTKVSPVTETSPVTEVTVTGDTFGERGDISGKRG